LVMGGGCHVRVVTRVEGDDKGEHPWVLKRMRKFGSVEIVQYEDHPQNSDLLVFYLVKHGRISDRLSGWRARAKLAACLLNRECPTSRMDLLREAVRSFPHYINARRITFRPYVHPDLIGNTEWLTASFGSIDADAPRRWRIGFL